MGTVLTAVEATDQQARLLAARSALTRAETAAGLRTRLQPAGQAAPAVDVDGAAPPASHPPTGAPVSSPEAPTSPGLDDLPVPGPLAPLFPGGVLARGGVVQVAGSTSLLLALTATLATTGAWTALTALPDVGWRAAAEAGLDLGRVVAVPRPGPDAPVVLGALVDGLDVLVVGRCPALAERERRSLSARLRARRAVLLSTDPWPGAGLVLQARRSAWEGLGQGWGNLARQQMTVTATGRGVAAGTRRTVAVSLGPGGVQSRGERLEERAPDRAGDLRPAAMLRAV